MKKIMFDAERMKYEFTGLYYFCQHLGGALLNQSNPEEFDFGFYAPSGARLPSPARMVRQSSLHKFHMPFNGRFDLWHSTFQGTNYFPYNSKGKIVLTVHDLNFLHEGKDAAKQKKYMVALEKKLARADGVVAISNFVKEELLRYTSVAEEKVKVIYNGCNVRNTGEIPLPRYIPPQPFFFTLGTIAAKKNFHVIPAMLLDNEVNLVISGITVEDAYRSKIENTARSMGVLDRVHFTGAVTNEELLWYYRHCTAFAFPSLAEGFGLPVIEAMRFGKPVFLSKLTCLPEIGGDMAYYFDSFDPKHMSARTNEGLADFEEKNKGNQVVNHSEQFSWEKAANQYLDFYREVQG